MTNSAQEQDGVTSPYYGRPLAKLNVDIENTRNTPAVTNICSTEAKVIFDNGNDEVLGCELVSKNFSGVIPASSKMIVDLWFFPTNFKIIGLDTVLRAKLTWRDYDPETNQPNDLEISLPIQP